MIALVSMLGVVMLMGAAVAIIFVTLRDHADAIVAALAGRSLRAQALVQPAPRVRVTFRTPVRRPASFQPLRAAA